MAIDSIIEISQGIPRKILENCERVCIEVNKKDINRHDVEAVLLNETKESFSPMQQRIVDLLNEGEMTVKEIVEKSGSTEGSIGKQISNLMQENLVKIVNDKRPKVYGLVKK